MQTSHIPYGIMCQFWIFYTAHPMKHKMWSYDYIVIHTLIYFLPNFTAQWALLLCIHLILIIIAGRYKALYNPSRCYNTIKYHT